MASSAEFIAYVTEAFGPTCPVDCRKMFGEYGVYLDDKLIALVCDDQLFIKPTDGGRAFIGDPVEAPPYPGARNSFLIDDLEDREWLCELARITARERPLPKKKKRKS